MRTLAIHLSIAIATATMAPVALAGSETGGSGLADTDYAWSMPITDVVVGVQSRYVVDSADDHTRSFRLTPSITKGFGGGFEGAVSIPFEGSTVKLDEQAFDRRFDLRRGDLVGKLRWTTNLGSPRTRFGVQGFAAVPLEGIRDIRAGGDSKPKNAFDPGVEALLSTDVGWFDFPIRVHANGGYWWSRDDGAIYFRDETVPVSFDDSVDGNNVVTGSAALEVGFRRFVGFTELHTQHLVGARAQMRGTESLWRLSPGISTQIAPDISLTAAISFDLSSDDDRTSFKPQDHYPDTELRIGISLGNVLSRNRYEQSKHRARGEWQMTDAVDSIAAMPPDITMVSSQEVEGVDSAGALVATTAGGIEPGPAPVPVVESAADPGSAPEVSADKADATAPSTIPAEPIVPAPAPFSDSPAEPVAAAMAPVTPEPPVTPVTTVAPVAAVAPVVEPAPPAVVTATSPVPIGGPGVSANADELAELRREIRERFRDIELNNRLSLIETRLGWAERTGAGTPGAVVVPGGLNAMSASDPRISDLINLTARLEQRLAQLEGGPSTSVAPVTPAFDPAEVARELRRLQEIRATSPESSRAEAETARLVNDMVGRMSMLEQRIDNLASGRSTPGTQAELEALSRQTDQLRSMLRESQAVPVSAPAGSATAEEDAILLEIEQLLRQFVGERPAESSSLGTETGATQPPIEIGGREWLEFEGPEVDEARIRGFVDGWSGWLKASPQSRIAVVVHGGPEDDREAALRDTQRIASLVRDSLLRRGVNSQQLVAMGMGRAEMDSDRTATSIEIERLR